MKSKLFILIGSLCLWLSMIPTQSLLAVPLSGTYTIGGSSPDYADFTAAVSALTANGISGSVIFDVRNGTYTEQISIPGITGASCANTITFQSESGDSSAVILSFSASSGANYTVQLLSADGIIFSRITIESTHISYGRVIYMEGEAGCNTFSHCRLKGVATTSTSDNMAVIFSPFNFTPGVNWISDFTLSHNLIENGSMGMYINPSIYVKTMRLSILENEFLNQRSLGVSATYCDDLNVQGNILNTNSTKTDIVGMNFGQGAYPWIVAKNQIFLPLGGQGIVVSSYSGTAGTECVIANNFVSIGGNSIAEGITTTVCQYADVLFNNINITNTGPGTNNRGMNLSSGFNVRALNNCISHTGGGSALDLPSAGNIRASDYNNLYVTGTNIGSVGGTFYTDLPSFQAASGHDANSLTLNPNYFSFTDLHVQQPGLNASGIPVAGITDDIDGDPRDPSTPDIGADEFSSGGDILGILEILSPVSDCGLGSAETLTVRIQNFSGTAQSGFNLSYALDGGMPVTENVGGFSIPAGGSGDFTFTAALDLSTEGSYDLLVFHGLTDGNAANDSLSEIVENFPPMSISISPDDTVCAGSLNYLTATGGVSYLWSNGVHSASTFVSPDTTTTWWVTVTNINGCQKSDTVTLFVIPSPPVPTISAGGPTTFCAEDSVTLTSSSPVYNLWSTGDTTQSIVVRQTNLYRVTVSSPNGCSTQSNLLAVNALPRPTISADPFTSICTGDTVTLTVNDADQYSWSTGATTQSIMVFPTDTTDYWVSSTNSLSCVYQDTATINTFSPSAPVWQGTMLPVDNALNLSYPLDLSWQPATHATHYDLYIWDTDVPEPTNPVYPPIYGINLQYLLPLPFGESYNWRLVAKNSCLETPGPVQTFSLRDLPDLEPFDLQVPASTFAGQNFNLSWKVKNQGSGGTGSQNWLELVFLSPDSVLGDDIAIGYADNLAYLNAGQSYTQVVSLPISPALFGSFYVFVVTDIQGGQGLVQETDEFNNFVRNPGPPIQIVPPPLPDLEVLALSAPSNIFSGNEITVNWTIENIGDADALSDRKKRNFTLNGCIWEERIWYDGIYLSQDSILDQSDILIKEAEVALRSMAYGGGVLCGNIGNWLAVPDYLSVDSSYSMSLGALVPHTLSGTWYVILEQDRRNDIVNNGFAAKYGVSGPVTITLSPPPDLVVSAVNPPPAIESGTSVSISWSVMNQGSNAPFEKTWTDRVYLSKLSTFNIDSTIYLGALSHYNGDQLGAGQSYSAGKSFPIPGWINGNYYVYVHTDATQKVFEFTFDGNNIGRSSSAVAIMPGDRPDLKVTQIILPDTLWAGEYFSIQWTVQNLGPKTTSGNWFDKIYLSSDTVWDPASDRLIHSQSVSLALTQGQKSTQSATFRLPADANSPYTLFVYTDATNKVFEETENNNLAAHSDFIPSGPVLIPRIPTESDLEIISFNPATSLNSGKDLTVSWTVQNTGTSATNLASWYDKLFLSQDLIPDGQDFTLLNSGKSGGLLSGALYQTQGTFRVPDGLSGAWYLLLSVDHGKTSGDTILANHFSAIPVNISLSPPPDLVVQGFTVPDTLIAGQTLAVSFSIKNTGTGDLLSSDPDWIDALYLSSTPDLSGTPVHLGSRSRMTGLAVDSSYTVNMNVVIPAWLSGFYYCIARTDKTDKVYEDAGESNNLAFELVEIIIPDPSDLVVTRLELPDSVKLGETISVQYTLQNNGANPALGNLRDALYFSLDSVYDGSLDLLIRSFESNINIGPSDTLSRLLTAQIRDANPGDYHGIMRTNLLNTVNETDLDNNLRIDPDKITVDVAELFLSVPDTQALNEGDVLYYRLNVPADLDLILRLFSNKTIGSNSVYVAYNRIPTLFDYDFRNPDPQSVDQEILIAGTTAGDYYIMVRTASAFSNQEVELIAEGLPFSLLTIDPNEVGQGIVTTHIRGAGFRDSMQVFLKDNGLVVATATRVILESSMEAQIKWDLENVSSGTYDVAAVNPDLSEVLLLDGLQVEPSTGIRVSFFPIVPNALRKGRTGFYSFFLRNTGNVDADFVQADISFPIEAFVQSLSISGEVMTRTEMGQGEFQEDYLETAKLKIIPLWVHDLSPGEEVAIGAMLGGFNRTPFPVRLRVNATNTQSFIQQQLGNLETFRLGILNDPVNYPFGPDVVNLAGDPIAFRDTMLTGYFQLGIFSPEDTIGMNLNCTVCTGPSGVTAIAGEFDFNPGNSPGKLSLLTAEFGSGGTFLCEINRYEGTAGEDPGWDQIEVSGALTITADAFNPFVIHLASLDYYGLPDYLAGWHPAVDVCWPVVSAQGGINGFDPNTVILNTDLFTQFNETYGGTFSLELSDPNTISVCFTAYQPGPGEAGVPGAPGAPCECGSPGGPGGDGDGSTPPGNGGAGGQGGPGNVDCEPGDGGPGGAGGNGGNGQQGGNGGAGGEGGVGSDGQDGGNGGMGGDGGQGGSDADGGNGGEGGAGGQGGEGANGGSGGIGGQGGNGSGSGNGGSGGGGGIGGFGGGGGIGGTGGGGGTGGDKGPSGMDDGDSGTSGDDGSMGAKEAKCNDREKRTQQTLQKICNVAFTTTGCGIAGAGCAAGMASCATILGCPVGLALCGLGLFGCAYGIVGSVTELPDGPGDVGCIGVADYVNCVAQKVICNNVLRPCDPNDIAGPEGYGAEGFVAKTEVMPYLIRFENESGVGNAAAQRVSIHLPIDADLNPLSFRLGNFGFGNWVFQVPAGVSNYNTVLDLRDPYGLLVEVTAGLDIVNNELIWVFQSVDPGTSLPPANPFAGFLPVNDSTGAGEGFATFTIKPKSTAQTGDSITAQAGIIFDINDPVITNTALNLIDAEPPMTSVAGLPDSTYQTTFEVQITGADDPGGSGIQEYALYVSEDSSNFLLHEAGLIQPSVLFTGLPGKTYRFFSVSTDFVGNLEGVKTYAEETISIRTDAASCGKDSYEPNDLPALASNLYGGAFSGGKHSRKICPRFDQDWYYVNNQAGGQTLIVRLENLPADYNVYLYQNGIAVDSSVQAGTANDRIEYTAAPAGIYRILVKGAGDAWSATEDYTLIISTMLPAPSGGVKANIKDPIFRDPGMDAFFRVFPNPASDELNCTLFSEIETEGTIILSDPFGREIIREKISLVKGTQSIQWKLPDLAEGMYSISLQTDQEIRSEKVLILHK